LGVPAAAFKAPPGLKERGAAFMSLVWIWGGFCACMNLGSAIETYIQAISIYCDREGYRYSLLSGVLTHFCHTRVTFSLAKSSKHGHMYTYTGAKHAHTRPNHFFTFKSCKTCSITRTRTCFRPTFQHFPRSCRGQARLDAVALLSAFLALHTSFSTQPQQPCRCRSCLTSGLSSPSPSTRTKSRCVASISFIL
jgi:hypothetical protein